MRPVLFFLLLLIPLLVSADAVIPSPLVSTDRQQWRALDLSYDGTTLTFRPTAEAEPQTLPATQLRCIRFAPVDEQPLAQLDEVHLQKREKGGQPFSAYPEKILLELELPARPSIYLTPFAKGMGNARSNTFRIWAGETYLDVQGRGTGKTEMTAMINWRKNYPRNIGGTTLLQFYFDRKAETCVLRANHRHLHTWKMPTSYEENPEGETAIWYRAGLVPHTVRNLRATSWTHNRNPEADLTPLPDREKLWLQNGDVLEGEVLGITDKQVQVQVSPELEIPLPIERVLEIHFRKPPPSE